MNPSATETNHLADSVVVITMGIITCGILLLIPTFVAQLTGGSMAIGQAWTAVKNVASSSGGAVGAGANAVGNSASAVGNGARGVANAGGAAYGGVQSYNQNRASGMGRGASASSAINRVASLYKK